MCKFLPLHTQDSWWLMNYRHGTLFIVSVVLTTYKKDKLCQPLWSLSCISINGKKNIFRFLWKNPECTKMLQVASSKIWNRKKKERVIPNWELQIDEKKTLFATFKWNWSHTEKEKCCASEFVSDAKSCCNKSVTWSSQWGWCLAGQTYLGVLDLDGSWWQRLS